MGRVNLGNQIFRVEAVGADEAIEKLNLLEEKLKEAKSLIKEIASLELSISFTPDVQQEDEEEGI